MKLIVGLGNPGARYRGTRHNVGFMVVDDLAGRHQVTWGSAPAEAMSGRLVLAGIVAWLVKPLTFMNLSGRAVADLVGYYRVQPSDLLVVTDDVHLPLGRLRARAGGSAGGHNGLQSIVEQLGTDEYPRLRLGVGRGDPAWDLADRVLARFEASEREPVQAMVTRAADAVETFLVRGLGPMMNVYNQPPEPAGQDAGARENA